MTRPSLCSVLLLGVIAATGCDDVVLYDVSPSGALLVAADAQGKSPLLGSSKTPRHLFWVDPNTGVVTRLTQRADRFSWPRVCGAGAIAIVGGRELVHVTPTARRTLFTSRQRLFNPIISPRGDRLAVLEATRLGTSGRLRVLDRKTGRTLHQVDHALLGAVWTRAGLLVPRSRRTRTEPFASAPGEVIRLDRRHRSRTIFRGTLPGVTLLSPTSRRQVLSVLHIGGSQSPLGLARLATHRRAAQRGKRGPFDFWPSLAPDRRRVLFTRSRPGQPSVQAQLRLTTIDKLTRSRRVPTRTAVAAPRWVGGERVSYLTADDRLVVQDLDGRNRLDLTQPLRAAFAKATRVATTQEAR